jgi:hypothetical protein
MPAAGGEAIGDEGTDPGLGRGALPPGAAGSPSSGGSTAIEPVHAAAPSTSAEQNVV